MDTEAVNGLQRHRDRLFQAFPIARALERALRASDNQTPFFYFQRSDNPDLKGCWMVLGRLGRSIEEAFSITSEALFLFTPYADLQRRTFNAMTERVPQDLVDAQKRAFGTPRFTADRRFQFLWSPDPRMTQKLSNWNAEGARSLVVPITNVDDSEDALPSLREAIVRTSSERDLYRGRNPVHGAEFFGREELIRWTEANLTAGRSIGLFGLRRSGKTSLVRQLQLRFESAGTLVVLVDLERVESLNELPEQISFNIVDGLRRMKAGGLNVWIGSESEQVARSFSALSTRLGRVAERNSELKIVIAVDEVENLSRLSVGGATGVRNFLGALRGASQSVANLTLLLTGITAGYFEKSLLEPGTDNPLFGFIEPAYLGAFEPEETRDLLETLGAWMFLEWTPEALEEVHRVSGGFPFFVRELASAVNSLTSDETLSETSSARSLGLQDVAIAREKWRDDAALLWNEIVESLETYHPVMAEICRAPTDGAVQEWLDVGDEGHHAVRSLRQVGLLTDNEYGRPIRSRQLCVFQELSRPAVTSISDVQQKGEFRERVLRLAGQEEGQILEFKGSARVNLHTHEIDKRMEREVVKTVAAFLNAEGGTLLIGVSDSHDIIGLAPDLNSFQGSQDKLEAWLMNSLLVPALGATVLASQVRLRLGEVTGRLVAEVIAGPSVDPVWAEVAGEELLFLRMGNTTKQLKGREIAEFSTRRLRP